MGWNTYGAGHYVLLLLTHTNQTLIAHVSTISLSWTA